MKKIILSPAHLAKRREKKKFSMRYDIFGSHQMRELSPKDYFELAFSYPKAAERILIDGMYSGDWYSVYESELLPLRRNPFLARFRSAGVDIFAAWVDQVHSEGKECFLTHRIAEVEIETKANPPYAREAHPEWFVPAFGRFLNSLAFPEVREHKRRVLGEVLRKYPFDGLDIDFERHTPILPVGHQWEMRECVTDFMRTVRRELWEIEKETGRVVQLSARVPDCLAGCREDGLDIKTWVEEDLVDALTLGSRSFDVHAEEFRALTDIQLFCCYDLHHTVDGYAFPPLETIRGIFYSWLVRGADGVEYFNWTGEGASELLQKFIALYGTDPARDSHPAHVADDFCGVGDADFLAKQSKTYVLDRRGGYPWGIGFGNLNADKQLPLSIQGVGEARIYLPEGFAGYQKATLCLLLEETTDQPKAYFDGMPLSYVAEPYRDLQVTDEKGPPNSGYGVTVRILAGEDHSKPCTLLTADLTGIKTAPGYHAVRLESESPLRLEKLEVVCEKIDRGN